MGVWAKPAKSHLSKSHLCRKATMRTTPPKIKQRGLSPRGTRLTTFYGVDAGTGRRLRFLGGETFIATWENPQIPAGSLFSATPHTSVTESAQTQIPSLKSLNLRER